MVDFHDMEEEHSNKLIAGGFSKLANKLVLIQIQNQKLNGIYKQNEMRRTTMSRCCEFMQAAPFKSLTRHDFCK